MNFGEAIASGFSNYVNFSGRAARSEYWFWTLFVVIVSIVCNIIDMVATAGILGIIVGLGLFLPGLAVSIRRLHDLDRTGWWVLIAFTGIGIILLIVWACMKGTDGPNQYGPDPLGMPQGIAAPMAR
jgi:uncharacterized membrane protein YhaH (DUF805 family)